jgi:hypothetical protein
MALTAAVWSRNLSEGAPDVPLTFQTSNLPSLPPLARSRSFGLHFSPHTSPMCPLRLDTKSSGARGSRCKMRPSPPPLLRSRALEASAPTRERWPPMLRTRFMRATSQRCTSPAEVPTARIVPRCVNPTDVTESPAGPTSQRRVASLERKLFMYTHEPKPATMMFWEDQST